LTVARKLAKLSLVMQVTNIHEAKTHLSRLIDRVEAGEEIIIARAGKPVVRMVAYKEATPPKRTPGAWKGKVRMSRDFDELPDSIAAAFRGERP
jgi:prevent-host-death family protein